MKPRFLQTLFWNLQISKEKHAFKAWIKCLSPFIIPTEYTHKNKVINIKAYVMKKSLQGPCHERSLDAHLLWSMSLPISQLTHPPARGGRTTSWNLKKHHQRAWLTFYHHHHHHYDAYHHCRHWENTTIEVFAHVEKLGSFLSYFRRLRIINVFH